MGFRVVVLNLAKAATLSCSSSHCGDPQAYHYCCHSVIAVTVLLHVSVFSGGYRRPLGKDSLNPQRLTTHRLRTALLDEYRITEYHHQWYNVYIFLFF